MYLPSRLRVSGDEVEMAAFLKTLTQPNAFGWPTVFSLHQTVPSQNPELLADLDTIPNREVWGSLWDVIEPRVWCQTTTAFEVQFKTLWSVPDKWLQRVADRYPRLDWVLDTPVGSWSVTRLVLSDDT